ncbi:MULTISPECIES: hypothetical protein [Bizionia]|uniref:Carboxypeptidase-like regulatory domain-containing protein n=1 Tax=Bizionia algoritergicola TaxID=291187 RepID=A0A5D0QVW8_9FLAO|nr:MULTISPECIES: hypothetical protein [Bizionia]OBX21406.1 hypothetical protein BAA08_12695 [Bizionia sp. APA-3]TYB72946.1 hypothetical protein ES675_10420 [Bizionia algoritergicola]
MKAIRFGFLLFIFTSNMFSQTTDLEGQVITNLDAENIHIINKTSKKFTITNASGGFVIPGKLNDIIIISSIQHQLVSLVVDAEMLEETQIQVFLEPLVNMLDEVVVGKVLSGYLLQDVQAVEGQPMTAKKAGIPSYQGKMPTQTERRLSYAKNGMIGMLVNTINGNIKRYKMQAVLEEKDELLHEIRVAHEADLFANYPLEPASRMDYFYFCSEDSQFLERCKNKNGIVILQFLVEKLELYKQDIKK